MRAHRPPLDARGGLIVLFLFALLLPGCTIGTYDVNYPGIWEPRAGRMTGRCPNIEGLYFNKGVRILSKVGSDCRSNCCGALLSELTDGGKVISWTTVGDKECIKDRIIEIKQPTDLLLEVTEWKEIDDEHKVMSQFELTADNGDFQCKDGELWLNTRVHTDIFLVSNGVVTETRVFNKSEDGALVMKRFTKGGGHNFVFPMAYGVGEWIRWPAAERPPDNPAD